MIHIRYRCLPSTAHPKAETVGDTWCLAWLRVRSFAEAKALAENELRNRQWDALELEEIFRVPADHYAKDDPHYEYYCETEHRREVYAYFLSPKYPAYCIELEAVATQRQQRFPPGTKATVIYWVLNSTLVQDADFFNRFWEKPGVVQMAEECAQELVKSSGWQVEQLLRGYPTNCHQYAPNSLLAAHYDEAEDVGECIAFWPEVDPETVH